MRKKNFRKTYLSFSVLLVLIMTLVSCEKQQDDFYPDNQNLTIIDKLENTIHKDDLFSNFYHKHKINIDWDTFKIYENNNKLFYEFNVSPKERLVNDLPSIFSQSSSYSVLAFESDNRIIIHLIEYRPYAYSDKTTNSLFDLNSFSGIVKYFDERGKVINSQIYKQGELLKTDQEGYISQPTKKDKSNVLNRTEPCDTTTSPGILTVTETTYHYVDWYRGVVNKAGQIELTFVRSEYTGSTTKIYTYEYFSCDTPHSGDEVYKSEYSRLQKLIDDELYENDPVANPDQITNELTGKADCVYGKMVDNNNNINWILENFQDGNKPSEFNLILKMSTSLGNSTNASTSFSSMTSTFTININANTLDSRTSIGLARTIIYEGIHARLREFAYRQNSNATSFPGIYEYYRIYQKNWDHQQMADFYRGTIAEGLKQFDNGQHSDEFYNSLAWEGLANIVDANGNSDQIYTEAWKKLSLTEQNKIIQIINNYKLNGNKDCN